MSLALVISPHGRPFFQEHADGGVEMLDAAAKRIRQAFDESLACGLMTLATRDLQTQLSAELSFLRDFARE